MSGTNSVLTEKQREFLETPTDERDEQYSRQMVSYHWQNIRSRIWAGLRDFELLSEELTDEERRMMLGPVKKGDPLKNAQEDTHPLLPGASHYFPGTIAFLYQHEDNRTAFGETIEKGIKHAEEQEGWFADVDVDITVERPHRLDEVDDLDETKAILEGNIPDSMTQEEYEQMAEMLYKADVVSDSGYMRMQAFVREHDFSEE